MRKRLRKSLRYLLRNTAAGERVNYLEVAKGFVKNRIMIAVVLSYVIMKLFTQTVSTTNQYVFMVYFQDTSMLSISSLASMIPMLIGMVCLKPLVKKFGKKNLVSWPILFAGACYAATAILPMTPITWIACQLLASLFSASLGLLLWSLIADAVDYQAYLTGQRNDGTVYATITFIVFFASSASTSLIALLLDAIGYDSAAGSMNQAVGVAERIKLLGGLWPAIGCVLMFLCFTLIYNISDEEMRKVSDTLREQSEAQEAAALQGEGSK